MLYRKRLVEEIKPQKGSRKPSSEFEENLKKKYSKNTNSKPDEKPLKLYESKDQEINVHSSKRLQPKKPLFGRALCPKTEEVRIKFLLNGVENIKDVFFYLTDEVNN